MSGDGAAITAGGQTDLRNSDVPSIDAFLAELARRDIRVTLDGEKLRISAPAGAVDSTLKTELARRKPELVAALRASVGVPALVKVSRAGTLPVSFAQQRLWFLDQIQPGASQYNIVFGLRLTGQLDQKALQWALDELVRRHEPLHTAVHQNGSGPEARLMAVDHTTVELTDVSSFDPDQRAAEAQRLARVHTEKPFDLARGPLAAFKIIRLSDDESWLVASLHHIASDGWSLGVVMREMGDLYEAKVNGRPSPLPPLEIEYVDYAAWQHALVERGVFSRQLDYWRNELGGAPSLLDLPTDRSRPAVQGARGARLRFQVDDRLYEALKAFSLKEGATFYMTLLAGWQMLLYRHSGQDDVVVGSPMANRDRPELEPLIGCFVNNVAMRGRLEGNPTAREFLGRVKSTVLNAFDNREVPFDQLVDALRPERSTSYSPVFQVMFTLHSFPLGKRLLSGLQVELLPEVSDQHEWARFDIALDVDELEGSLRMAYEYATDLFDAATIERLHAQYVTLLRAVVADPDRRVADIPLLAGDEQQTLLAQLNSTEREHDRTRSVHELVLAAADRHPAVVAVETGTERLTYAELVERAKRLARVLQSHGARPGTTVGVCLDRTAALPVSLLAVLMSGAAYVPVDPAHPAERIAHTLQDAQVLCVLTAKGLIDGVDLTMPSIFVDAPTLAEQQDDIIVPPAQPSDLAYVIYTSGSTGRPKGVEVEHRNVVNFLHAMQQEPGFTHDDVLLAVTTPSFDIAGLEMWLPLITGGRLVIASRGDVLDGERLRAHARRAWRHGAAGDAHDVASVARRGLGWIAEAPSIVRWRTYAARAGARSWCRASRRCGTCTVRRRPRSGRRCTV